MSFATLGGWKAIIFWIIGSGIVTWVASFLAGFIFTAGPFKNNQKIPVILNIVFGLILNGILGFIIDSKFTTGHYWIYFSVSYFVLTSIWQGISAAIKAKSGAVISEPEALKKIESLLAQPTEPPTLIYKHGAGFISTTNLSSLGGKSPSVSHTVVYVAPPIDSWILTDTNYVQKQETYEQLIEKVKDGSVKIVVHNTPANRIIQVF
jgi:hypothetical protein